jgi:hypothetical protein
LMVNSVIFRFIVAGCHFAVVSCETIGERNDFYNKKYTISVVT